MNIVSTTLPYSFFVLKKNMQTFKSTYPFLQIGIIGYSVLGNPLYALRLGTGPKEVFYSAAYHANEWITSPLMMKFIEEYCDAYKRNGMIQGYPIQKLFETHSIYIVPMVNPDGVNLVTNSLQDENAYSFAKSIANRYPSICFPNGWKANIDGVDLNLQFPAGWESAREIKFSQGFTGPAPRDYVGHFPLSTPEAKAIYSFTLMHSFQLVLAYHTQGEEIYWKFQDYMPKNSLQIGEQFAKVSGYTLAEVPYNSSFAGYKDWFIQNFNLPGYTIEAGLGESPLPISQFDSIYEANKGILLLGAVLS